MSAHKGLAIHFEADHRYIDLIEERIDIAIRMSLRVDDHQLTAVPLARVDQVLVASPSYLNQASTIARPEDLRNHELLPVTLMHNYQHFAFRHGLSGEIVNVDMKTRLGTNNVFVAKSLCQQGHGIARILYMDIQKELINGSLVEVLPDWQLPAYTLHALTSKREQYPMKVHRCIDALKQYFAQLPGGRSLLGVA
jgi:DNA-binding transcriptional LysR family regulator